MDQTSEIETPKTPPIEQKVDAPWKNSVLANIEDFRELDQGSQIEVRRLSPNQIKGYCGHIIVPDGGISDVMEEIKATYGGGRYQLRGKKLADDGRLNYVSGSVQCDVAGYPRDSGKEWINGLWRPIAMPMPAAPIPVRQTASNSQSFGMEGLMSQFLSQALQGALSGDSGINLGQIAPLITAIAGLQQPSRERDSFSDLERTLSLVDKLEKRRSPEPAPAPVEADGDGMNGILQLLAAKFLGPQNPQNPPPTSNYAPQMPQNAPPSSQQVWEQAQANAQVHGQVASPQNSQDLPNQQQPIQPNSTGRPPGVPVQPVTPPPVPSPSGISPDDSQEYEPLTTDDIMADLASRDEASRLAFLDDLCTKLGLNDALTSQMFPSTPSDEAIPTRPPPPASAPRLDTSYEREE